VSRWFKDIILADVYNRKLWGVINDPNAAEIRAHVDKAVDVFLKAFG
jgi:AefR-like transcriptional repressor, C-terminal domain